MIGDEYDRTLRRNVTDRFFVEDDVERQFAHRGVPECLTRNWATSFPLHRSLDAAGAYVVALVGGASCCGCGSNPWMLGLLG